MPRCRVSFPLISALLLAAACGRSTSNTPAAFATNAPALATALRERDPVTRVAVARFIVENSVAIDPATLIRGLGDSTPDVRRYCAVAVGRTREQGAIRPLFELLQDEDWRIRSEAAVALGRIGDPRAAAWMVQLLYDPDAYVRLCAGTALRELTTESHRLMLRQAFDRAQPPARANLALALAKLQEPVALETLTGMAQTNNATLRRRIAEALGDYPVPDVTNVLSRLLADADQNVRETAAQALRRVQTAAP